MVNLSNPVRQLCTGLLIFLLFPLFCAGQESYTATWTIQNPAIDLRQEFAELVIDRINNWATRNDVEAQVARLDDPLQIKVLGTYDPVKQGISERIIRINAGPLVIEDDPTLFLETRIIDSLIRRNYRWRDLSVDVVDSSLLPEYYRFAPSVGLAPTQQFELDRWTSDRTIISLIESRFRVGRTWRARARVGWLPLALPGLSFGQVAIGIGNDRATLWGLIPLPRLDVSGIGGPQQGAFGGGASFELPRIGGSITFVDPRATLEPIDTPRSMLIGTLRLHAPWTAGGDVLGGRLRLEFGGLLYSHGIVVPNGTGGITVSPEIVPRLSIMSSLSVPGAAGSLRRRISIGTTGTSFTAGWWEQFNNHVGIEFEGAVNGLIEDPLPFLPSFALWITPVFVL